MENFAFNKDKVQSMVAGLQSLLSQDATRDRLLATAQLLVAELQHTAPSQSAEKHRVSVVMPATISVIATEKAEEKTAPDVAEKSEKISQPEAIAALPENKETVAKERKVEPEKTEASDPVAVESNEHFKMWDAFGIVNEAPTISYYRANETDIKELNEKYNGERSELIQTLQSTPIKDLTSAIGINDRYLYINELFRGDESMYERSVITLNKFGDYDQAYAWVQRELHLKLGWDLNNKVARQFEQLIQRRFRR